MPDGTDITREFERLLRSVDHTATSTTKYRNFEQYLGRLIGVSPGSIYTTQVAKPGNFDVRMTQSTRARTARVKVALLPTAADAVFVKDMAVRSVITRDRGAAFLLVSDTPGGWVPQWGIEPSVNQWDPASPPPFTNLEAVPGFQRATYPYSPDEEKSALLGGQPVLTRPPEATPRLPPSPIAAIPLVLDPRIWRMLRNAVASSKAVMLVGPPGTGKSTLVEELVRESAEQPGAYGLSDGHALSVVTPDEGWTVRELVGGTTIDRGGQLRFAPGHVLRAIAADEWLLLDEANRADLDRIFGGLLTWLAGQRVSIGRETPGSTKEIILSWSDQPRSDVQDFEATRESAAATVYRAGQDWRLFGTYNSLDAHRVFRLGLALGRRFAQVPVPPPSAELFQQIVEQRVEGILDNEAGRHVADVVARIYEIHATVKTLALGPALFLTIPGYVVAGLRDPLGSSTDELVAEAYLSAFGTWLARLEEDTLNELGNQLSQDSALGGQWQWVREQLPNLA
jgi:MoxR-like ATPase